MEITTPVVAKGTVVIGGGSLGAYGVTELVKSGDKEEVTSSKSSQVENSDTPVTPVVVDDLSLKFLFNKDGFGTTGDYVSSGTTFGYAFGRFMLDPDENEDKWSILENQAKVSGDSYLSEKFKQVKKSQENGGKKIQDICKESYKENKSSLFTNDKSTFLLNIWKYCSPFNEKLSDLGSSTIENNSLDKWGWKSGNHVYLLGANNEKAWKHVFENVLKKDLNNENKKGNIDDKFSQVNSGTSLKDICLEAHKTVAISTVSNYGNSAVNYCRLDQSKTLDGYPTKPS